MAVHHLTLPLTHEAALALTAGDVVYLNGEIVVTGGLPAHKRIFEYLDQGKDLPVKMDGTFIHLPHMVEERADGEYDIHYVNPTTSTRFDDYMPRLIRSFDLTIVGGKGGLGGECVKAMHEKGCIYVSLLGGGSALLSSAIKKVLQVEWRDFPAHFRLSRLLVEDFGPLTVGIDGHGSSIYETLSAQAQGRLPAILERLEQRREEPAASAAPGSNQAMGGGHDQ